MVMLALILRMHTLEDAGPIHASRNTGLKRCRDAVLEWSGLLSTIVAPPLLAILCLPLPPPPFGPPQDAASATLPTANATPTPTPTNPPLQFLPAPPPPQT